MNIQNFLSQKVSQAMILSGLSDNSKPQIYQSEQAQFGHYQVNSIMALAKKLHVSPIKLAKQVLEKLDLHGIAQKVEIMNPGFINIFLEPKWLALQIDNALEKDKLGITPITQQTIVVDYSSPNVAKEMHVGHLRSTIIGDAMVRTLEFLGHHVIRANHIGDWGTHFGMLIAFLEEKKIKNYEKITLNDLENLYRKAKDAYDEDIKFAERAREYVVKLQNGDNHCRKLWQQLVHITMTQNQALYERMNVTLTSKNIMGESLYQNMMPDIVSDLRSKKLAVKSQDAVVVFLNKEHNKSSELTGVIIQKKDGAYLYTTTDIACIKYRCQTLHADRVLYYIDSRQKQHLTQAWQIARQAGYIPENVQVEHHMFGMMLSKNGKPFKTRTGNTIKLSYLLDEAINRATKLVLDKNPDIPKKELKNIAEIIGIGSMKYADLAKNRTTNYIFDWDNMLSLKGNTAPYIQYAYIRVLSIFRKANIDLKKRLNGSIYLSRNHSVELALDLLRFDETVKKVACDGMPHLMCAYLYNLSSKFSQFYETCQILEEKDRKIKQSYLKLAQLTAKTLKQGLTLLGIKTVEHM
ncbi:arginine--tRNA ligase [Candidatus Erwinia haradaeae]|uniref:Arginine--tRNA ligase n=1 Tax=Candidatus Erwinia haradaeae TaxID=1922217 RepID=A0A451DHJ0_9GAMM|nr:arginine--tRNA ligase [Candidatus Erwinia haradaeae]VFP86106.1 Arginine--tRNA ligase [Candidatus Erwinia haradaeae]